MKKEQLKCKFWNVISVDDTWMVHDGTQVVRKELAVAKEGMDWNKSVQNFVCLYKLGAH